MKKIVVMGLGTSGFYASLLAIADGRFHVVSWDENITEDLKRKKEIIIQESLKRRIPVSVCLGRHNIPDLDETVDLVVVSPGIPLTHPFVTTAKERGIKVIGEMEFAFQYLWDERDKIIAITGTNGKTTTTTLTAHILSRAGYRVFKGGNLGEPLSKYALLGKRADFVVLEVSSFQLETTERFRAKVGAVLNIDEDHLDRHRSFESYAETKFKLVDLLETQPVLNADDPVVKKLADEKNITKKGVWFSLEKSLEKGVFVKGGWIKDNITGIERKILHLNDLEDSHVFNLPNIAAALAITTSLIPDLDEEILADAVQSFEFPPHRMEFLGEFKGRKVYNDSKATNPHAVKRALSFLPEPKIVLIMGGADKNLSFKGLKGLIKEKVKTLILYGEAAERIQEELGDLGVPTYRIWHFEDAVRAAWSLSAEGDVILLSPGCASFDQFKSYVERGLAFRKLILELGVD